MTAQSVKRFYKDVIVRPAEGGFGIALDERILKTPGKVALVLPQTELAEAIAAEWRAQGDKIIPASMPLTKLANTAIDRTAAQRGDVCEQLLGFGRSDVVCYRAEIPVDLLQRQMKVWDPILDWAETSFGARLKTGQGIGFIEQDDAAMDALRRALATADNFRLTGLYNAAAILGSLVLALALDTGRMTPEEAFLAAHLDEVYQAEKWGEDWEAADRKAGKRKELNDVARFLQLIHSM